MFNPFMLAIGLYATAAQYLVLGDPGTVTRDQLGHLGGDPHFHPPRHDPVNDILHGIAPRALTDETRK